MKAFVTLLIVSIGFASLAQADYRCVSRSNGYSFSETRRDYSDARRAAVRECSNHYRTQNYECNSNVQCDSTYGRGNDFPRRGNDAPPVRSNSCYVTQLNQWVDGDEFFSKVHEWTVRNRTCAVAKIHSLPYSGRVYDRDGSRVAKESGGLSNSEVDRVLSRYNLWGCERFTCQERY